MPLSICRDFLVSIDVEGGLLTQAINDELVDEVRMNRLRRRDRYEVLLKENRKFESVFLNSECIILGSPVTWMRNDTRNSHAPDTSGTYHRISLDFGKFIYRPIGKTLLISFELHNNKANDNEKNSEKMSLSIFLLS